MVKTAMTIRLIIYYLLAVNVLTFIIYGIDKHRARHNRWRITETTLLLFAVLGGSPAALLAMQTFHHKTKHKKFRYGVPLILITQIVLLFLFLKRNI